MAVAKKFSEKADKKQDAKVMKGMTAAQKAKFIKADKVMDKKSMTVKQDMKADKAVAKKIMKKSK
jgi:hypothetical protein